MIGVRRGLVVIACTAALATAAPAAGGAVAARSLELQTIAAAPANRAAVVIDKGDGSAPVKVCVRFDAATITGEEALRLAAAQDPSIAPVFSAFSGMGKAVCELCGIGCPSGDCFCDPQRYWAYSRAEAGTSGFTTSPVGVSSTTVTDGDVEGYRWGSGAPPAFAGLQTICGEVLAETTTTTRGPVPTVAPPPPPPSTGPPDTAPPGGPPPTNPAAPTTAAPAGPAQAPMTPTPSDVGAPGAPTTTTSTTADPDPVDQEERGLEERGSSASGDGSGEGDGGDDGGDDGAGDPDDVGDEEASVRLTQEGETGGGGSGLALAGVGATFAALVGASVALQRARRGH